MDSAGDIAQQFVIEYGGQNSIIIPGTSGTPGVDAVAPDMVAYVDGAEGVFGTGYDDSITGDWSQYSSWWRGSTIFLVEQVRT